MEAIQMVQRILGLRGRERIVSEFGSVGALLTSMTSSNTT